MKQSALILVLFFSIISASFAQNTYKSAVGLRLGDGYYDLVSASLKTFLRESPGALEFNIGFRNYGIPGYDWFSISGSVSYQYHFNIGSVEGLRWFIGGGVTAYNTFSSYSNYSGFGVGVFPTAGVDYKFAGLPLDVSADIRPTIAIVRPYDYYNSFYLGNVGVSVRYTFR
jgi:hypothetical protein